MHEDWVRRNRSRANEIDREFRRRHRGRVIEEKRDYYAKNRIRISEWNRNYRGENNEKFRAKRAVQLAIIAGVLVRPRFCSGCGAEAKVQAHHDDYLKMLEVKWLCRSCHKLLHCEEKRRCRITLD
jgi:hypothetical protein